MDWSKSKNILIVALIATNIFLLVTLMNFEGFFSDDSLNETLDYLRKNGVEISESQLPTNIPKQMSKLFVRYDDNPTEEEMENAMKRQYVLPPESSDDDYKTVTNSLLNDLGVNSDSVEFKAITRTEDGRVTVEYRNVYGRFALEKSYIRCMFEEGRLVDFDRKWLVAEGLDNKIEIADVQKALRWFVSGLEGDSSYQVVNIELIYYLEMDPINPEDILRTTAFPYWKITYRDESGQEDHWKLGAYEE